MKSPGVVINSIFQKFRKKSANDDVLMNEDMNAEMKKKSEDIIKDHFAQSQNQNFSKQNSEKSSYRDNCKYSGKFLYIRVTKVRVFKNN